MVSIFTRGFMYICISYSIKINKNKKQLRGCGKSQINFPCKEELVTIFCIENYEENYKPNLTAP